jgi:hypothetical protein
MASAIPPIISPSTLPSQGHITLLFKHHKSTVLLSVSPTQPFSEIKTLLLAVLKSRSIDSSQGPSSSIGLLPSDPDELEFGVLIDKKDPGKGWTSLTQPVSNGDLKGKKKSTGAVERSKLSAGTTSGVANSPESAGLVDGSFVAYRIRSSPSSKKQPPSEDKDEDEEDGDVEAQDDPKWDVILPTFEDDEPEPEDMPDAMPLR